LSAFQTKNSVLFITEETTEGTPVPPSSATDAIALQDGFSFEPSFDTLENAELTGSLGSAKPIQGLENPTVSLNHYIRHSGVEGTEPNFGLLIEGAFGGKDVNAVEYDTVAGSTAGSSSAAAVLNVDVGEGVNFERGEAVLIKDGTNGFAVRNVKSVASDELTLNFNLQNAPAAGVNLGTAVLYKPGESFPTISNWLYRGNGAVIELMSGGRVTEMSVEVTAGELVNGSFTLEGVEYFFDPITIDATNNFLDFDDGGGQENAELDQKTYKDPHELAAQIQAKMDALTADNITVTYNDDDGKYTIATDGGTLSLLWSTGTNTATSVGATIGFDVAADDTAATSYEGDGAIDLTRPFTPQFDDADPLVAKNNFVTIGDFDDNICFEASAITITLTNTKTDILSVCAESGKSGTIITEREATIEVSALLEQYDADQFRRFRANQNTEFMYNFGVREGGNWVAGKTANVYSPTCTISEFAVDDQDGLVGITFTLTTYVEDGLGELYINFL
jgi:hypothetical protein